MVVEITPPGIRSLQWRFYIIWIVFNFSFIPIGQYFVFFESRYTSLNKNLVYLFYPETAGRSLEDLDRFFAGEPPLFVFKDKEAIAEKRPEQFVQREIEEVRRNSSIVPGDIAGANEKQRTEYVNSA